MMYAVLTPWHGASKPASYFGPIYLVPVKWRMVLSIKLDHYRDYLDGVNIDWKGARNEQIECREGSTVWGFNAEERSPIF